MNEPARTARRVRGGPNFTALQFVVFAGAGLVGVAALLAAGLAFGLAMAGAACFAVVVLAAWFTVANLVGGERPPRRATGPR